MMLNMYAVKDRKAEEYLMPFHAPNDAVARRMFQITKESQETLRKFPDDFELYLIGEYNNSTGELITKPQERIDNKEDGYDLQIGV